MVDRANAIPFAITGVRIDPCVLDLERTQDGDIGAVSGQFSKKLSLNIKISLIISVFGENY